MRREDQPPHDLHGLMAYVPTAGLRQGRHLLRITRDPDQDLATGQGETEETELHREYVIPFRI